MEVVSTGFGRAAGIGGGRACVSVLSHVECLLTLGGFNVELILHKGDNILVKC